ncbi:hypothetical protein U1Q18_052324, partial [Sarracenia purpurea var. burkii]
VEKVGVDSETSGAGAGARVGDVVVLVIEAQEEDDTGRRNGEVEEEFEKQRANDLVVVEFESETAGAGARVGNVVVRVIEAEEEDDTGASKRRSR